MKIEGKNIKILAIFLSAVAVVLVFAAGLFVFKKYGWLNLGTGDLSANQPLEFFISASPTPLPQENFLRMTFLGDIMLDRNVGAVSKKNGLDYLFEKIKDASLFQNKDLISGNLEGALTNNGEHYPPNVGFDFAFSPEAVEQLKKLGFNFFNLANNHFSDQGQRGISETRQNLETIGVDYSGCPDGQVGECSMKIVEAKNKKIGLAGFSNIYSTIDLLKMASTTANFKSQVDFLIINFHWGVEYSHDFSKTQQAIARLLIDSGADLVVGHHPHVVQGLEIYQGKSIFYSLGNFLFDQYFSVDTQEGLAMEVDFSSRQLVIYLWPFEAKQSQNSFLVDEKKQYFLDKFADWSQASPDFIDQIKSGKLEISL